MPIISKLEVLDFLESRASLIEAVCITGGEPTLQDGLLAFLKDLRQLKLKIKLDTNGTRPEIVQEALLKGLVDYIAMDIKCPFARYPEVTGANLQDITKIEQTVSLLINSDLEYEFRTTVVPSLLDEEDIIEIAKTIAGCRKYYLQQFRPNVDLLDPSLGKIPPFSQEKMVQLAAACFPYLANVQLRGC
jgi:pyruvate formate lyase activating enzyme